MHGATAPAPLPPRVWVVGPCGAGKSTVAARLASALGIEATHLDEIHWNPGWVETEPEEEERRIAAIVRRPSWVIDGNYSRLRRPRMGAVDLFVWLDLPLNVTFPRLLARCVVRAVKRVPCCNGNYESIGLTFLDRESILLWALTTRRRRRRQLTADLAGRPHVRLRSARAVEAWVRAVVAATAAASRHRS